MIRLLIGHVLDRLRELAAESVHCVVTSPPYYGLRDYGIEPQVWGGDPPVCCGGRFSDHDFQIEEIAAYSSKGNWQQAANGTQLATGKVHTRHAGDLNSAREKADSRIERGFCRRCGAWRGSLGLEPTLNLYLDHMVDVFREVRRVLRKDGTVWLNIGDSYANDGKWGGHTGGKHVAALHDSPIGRNKHYTGLKPKDLMLIPGRLAIRLQEDGWWVRSDIAWCKRAAMPESCTDRPTTAWEHVFLLTRSARYYYDAEAVKEEADSADRPTPTAEMKTRRPNDTEWHDNRYAPGASGYGTSNGKRNMRNFWLLGPEPFAQAHFATFPTEIPRRAILAGTSERGVCPKCWAPWARLVRKEFRETGKCASRKKISDAAWKDGWEGTPSGVNDTETIGWRPTCGCAGYADLHPKTLPAVRQIIEDAQRKFPKGLEPVPATVLDPFFGAGTTGLVADQLQRDCIGIDINPQYAAMAERRIREDNSLFSEVAAE